MLAKLATALVLILAVLSPAQAQVMLPTGDAPAEIHLPDPLTPEAVRDLVAGLSDADVRGLLLERLDAVAEARQTEAAEGSALTEFFGHATTGAFGAITEAVRRIPLLWTAQSRAVATFGARMGWDGVARFVAALAATLLAASALEWIVRRLLLGWQNRLLKNAGGDSLRANLKFLFARLARDVIGLIAFFFATNAIGLMLIAPMAHPLGALILTNLVALPRLAGAVSRFMLAPNQPALRIVHTDDWTARYLHRHQIGMAFLIGFTPAIVSFNAMNNVPMGELRLGFWLNLAVHVYIICVALRAWDGLVATMRGPDPDITATEERVARAYPGFAIVVSVVMWWLVNIIVSYQLFDLLATGPHYATMLLLLLAPAVDTIIRAMVRHLAPPMTGEGVLAERAHRATKRSYIRIGRVVAFALVLIMIARIWGIDFKNLAAANVGAQVAGRGLEILMILAAGYLLWELVSLWINRKLAAEQTAAAMDLNDDEPGGGEGGGAGGSRLSTVLPLFLGFLKVTIATIVALIALGNIGIDITPLLAGAGIVGIAVGFGAQKLVADVVSGVFFLVDDAFRTGEYVEVEGTVGTVEKISVRSMQLRHHKGPVHTIPYGEIPKITNYSRDWVIMKLKFTVPFGTDPNKVKKLFKQIGKEMMEVPEFAADLMQPFKSQGVFDFDDVGMIIRGKFMAKPGKQFTLRKEIYNRVIAAFDANGIDFARREVRVAIPGLDQDATLSDDDKAAIAAAATEAAQNMDEPPPKA